MEVQRIPINHESPKETFTRKVLIVEFPKAIGIYTGKDTLFLKYLKHIGDLPVYIDRDQQYFVKTVESKEGFAIFITPIQPFRRRLWSIILKY